MSLPVLLFRENPPLAKEESLEGGYGDRPLPAQGSPGHGFWGTVCCMMGMGTPWGWGHLGDEDATGIGITQGWGHNRVGTPRCRAGDLGHHLSSLTRATQTFSPWKPH